MFKSILVPLDGSVFAEAALPVAIRLARSGLATLRVVTVHEPAMALATAADIPDAFAPEHLRRRAQIQTYLADQAHRIGIVGGAKVDHKLMDGVAGPVIVDFIKQSPPDLVVMSTHGRGSLSRFWLGSVADYVIRHVHVPTLLIKPEDGSEVPAPTPTIRSILVPLDLSDQEHSILPAVEALASLTQAHITLFTVVEPLLTPADVIERPYPHPSELLPHVVERRRIAAQASLDTIADKLRVDGHRVATVAAVRNNPARAILDRIHAGPVDVVALATHRTGRVQQFLLGSVADKVIRGAPCPVMVLRPPEGR